MKHSKQQSNQAKNTLEKTQNYSRMPLTNDDNYIIMANMTNNDTITKKGVHTMKEIIVQIIAPLWATAIALLPAALLFIL